jgi:hypothetical protein
VADQYPSTRSRIRQKIKRFYKLAKTRALGAFAVYRQLLAAKVIHGLGAPTKVTLPQRKGMQNPPVAARYPANPCVQRDKMNSL